MLNNVKHFNKRKAAFTEEVKEYVQNKDVPLNLRWEVFAEFNLLADNTKEAILADL